MKHFENQSLRKMMTTKNHQLNKTKDDPQRGSQLHFGDPVCSSDQLTELEAAQLEWQS